MTCHDRAAVHESHDSAAHVLVDASQRTNADLDSGLFQDLAAHALLERFAQLQNAPGRFPVAVVTPLDHQDAAVFIDDDSGDAD